jgi:hypothetical protein
MSKIFDYFFNYSKDLTCLCNDINNTLGCFFSLCERYPDVYFCHFMGMKLDLQVNEMEEENGIEFQDYRYRLGLMVVQPDSELNSVSLTIILIIVHLLFTRLGIAGMLVCDFYEPLAIFVKYLDKSNKPALFDLLHKKVINFPQYLRSSVATD